MTRKWISDARPKPDPIGGTRDLRQNRVGLSIEAFIGNPHRIKAARLGKPRPLDELRYRLVTQHQELDIHGLFLAADQDEENLALV